MDTYYSVEWLPNAGPGSEFNCWNQIGLTRFKWLVAIYKFEARLKYGDSVTVRVREF